MGSDLRAQAEQTEGRRQRLEKFRSDYFSTPPAEISQLAADAMIVVIDLEAALRGVRDAERQRVKALVKAAEALSKKWGDEAHEIDQDGDFCCAQTRRNDAGELHDLLRKYAASSPRPSGEGEGGRP